MSAHEETSTKQSVDETNTNDLKVFKLELLYKKKRMLILKKKNLKNSNKGE